MTARNAAPQLLLRLALGISFLSAVADRLGLWGAPGNPGIAWGNWQNFEQYTKLLTSFLPDKAGTIAAISATILEVTLAFMLLLGFKIKAAAIATSALLASFALCMCISIGIKPSLDYSVWTAAAAALLLSSLSDFKYSIDNKFKKQL